MVQTYHCSATDKLISFPSRHKVEVEVQKEIELYSTLEQRRLCGSTFQCNGNRHFRTFSKQVSKSLKSTYANTYINEGVYHPKYPVCGGQQELVEDSMPCH